MRANRSKVVIEFSTKLLQFLERSDLYKPEEVHKLLPEDYLFKEKATLLVRMKNYREAFDVTVLNINDFDYCEHLASFAVD